MRVRDLILLSLYGVTWSWIGLKIYWVLASGGLPYSPDMGWEFLFLCIALFMLGWILLGATIILDTGVEIQSLPIVKRINHEIRYEYPKVYQYEVYHKGVRSRK